MLSTRKELRVDNNQVYWGNAVQPVVAYKHFRIAGISETPSKSNHCFLKNAMINICLVKP
jgi:hypothetical protein